MKHWMDHYRITLQTIGPVFVGTGEEIGEKEYMMLPDGRLAIVDPGALYAKVKQFGLAPQFEVYLIHGKKTLDKWLKANKISIEDVSDCFRYTLTCDASADEARHMAVRPMLKDAYYQPYVSGSSIKGMLRTILMARDVMRSPEKYEQWATQIRWEALDASDGRVNRYLFSKEMYRMEADAFHTLQRNERVLDATNDLMSGVIVSDSEPLSTDDLILCRKVDRNPDGKERVLPMLRECIAPGKEITFDLTLEQNGSKTVSIEDIREGIAMFAKNYNQMFLNNFRGMEAIAADELFLGGGAGYPSKTVLYPLFGKEGVPVVQGIFEKTFRNAREHKHHLDTRMGVSPHIVKVAYYAGRQYQMGLCKIGKIE